MTPEEKNAFRKILHDDCLISPEQLVLVGVSGGPDSIFLLMHLVEIEQPVVAAIFDHKIRPESADEVHYVQNLCSTKGIPCICDCADVPYFAQKQKIGLEEAARELRYRFLFDTARKMDAVAVAVGHHADDQAETVLMHVLRGSGIEGMSGMRFHTILPQWDKHIALIRPLLKCDRKTIVQWCKTQPFTTIEDSSNTDIHYFRNKLRHQLLPELEKGYNPQIRSTLTNSAMVLQNDMEIISEAVQQARELCIETKLSQKSCVIFKRDKFSKLIVGLQARLIREAAFSLDPDLRDISFSNTQQALSFFSYQVENHQQPWIKSFFLQTEGKYLIISNGQLKTNCGKWPQLPSAKSTFSISIGQDIEIGDQSLSIRCVDLSEIHKAELHNTTQLFIDVEKLSLPLTIRSAQAGERFAPYGMAGKTQKLSDFWINHKIPQAYRGCYPLLCDTQQIVCIPGIQIADNLRVTAETKHVLLIALK